MRLIYHIILSLIVVIGCRVNAEAQINTDQVMRVGQNALYFEDYMLSIQYFNQVIQAKPYLAQPYFYRAIAKLNLEDYRGAEEDATLAIERNRFITDAYEVRGVARQNMGDYDGAVADYDVALSMLPENKQMMFNKAMAQEAMGELDAAEETFTKLLTIHPGYDNGYMGRAKLRLAQGDTIQALDDINKTLTLNPNMTNAYVLRADIAINTANDYEQALADMDEAIKLQPQYVGFFINRAFLRYNLDDYFGAMADYDYALQLDPVNQVALFNRGLLLSEVSDNDKAIVDFNRVLQLDPKNYRALYNRALLYFNTHNYTNAINDISQVIEAFPDFATAYTLRSEIYCQMGNMRRAAADHDRAMAIFERLSSSSGDNDGQSGAITPDVPTATDEELVANRFTTLLTIENETDIEEDYNNKEIRGRVQDRNMNIEIEPMFSLSFYASPTQLKETTYYIKEVDEINATRILRFVVMVTNHEPQLNDENIIKTHFESIEYYNSYISTHAPRAIDYFGRAMDFMTIHNYSSAIQDLDKAVSLTPDFALAYLLRAVARHRNMEVEQLARDDAAVVSSDAHDVAMNRRKIAYAEILSDIEQVINLSPRMSIAYYNKGNILLEMQDLTSAISAYTKAIELKSDFGEAYYNRGYVYLKLGNKDAGVADLSKAGELGVLPSYNLLKRMSQ